MTDCIFCRMIAGEIKPDVVFEGENVFAFRDANPQAPAHILVIPKRHISTLDDLGDRDAAIAGELMLTATRIAKKEGLSAKGYRLVANCGAQGGQSVFHVHLHLLGGRNLRWPPG